MRVLPQLGFNELVSKFSAERVVRSGREVIPNRIGGVANHKIMNTFSSIATNLLASTSLNNINTDKTDKDISPVSSDNLDGVQTSVSSDGNLSTPISRISTQTEIVDDQVVEKFKRDGNIIKLGSPSSKEVI